MLFYLSVLNEFLGTGAILHAVTTTIAAKYENNMLDAAFNGKFEILHQQRSVHQVYNYLGPRYFCHVYHMIFESFWHLHANLSSHNISAAEVSRSYKKVGGQANPNPNLEDTLFLQFRMERSQQVFTWHVCFAILLEFLHVILHLSLELCIWIFFSVLGKFSTQLTHAISFTLPIWIPLKSKRN